MSPVRALDIVLTIYSWAVVTALFLFLVLIARFYELKSGQRSYFWGFAIPVVFFMAPMLRHTIWNGTWTGDWWSDLGGFLAGGVTFLLGGFLLRLMTGGRR